MRFDLKNTSAIEKKNIVFYCKIQCFIVTLKKQRLNIIDELFATNELPTSQLNTVVLIEITTC